MRPSVLTTILLSSIFLLFSQCKKDDIDSENPGEKRGEVILSEAELNIIPYAVLDTVVFKDASGNTLAYQVELRRTKLAQVFKDGGTDATTDYYEIESLEVILSNDNDNHIVLNLEAPLPYYVSNQQINKNYFTIYFEVPEYAFFNNYVDTTDFYYSIEGQSIPFHPSLTLVNNTYDSVYELYNPNFGPPIAYYNITDGIVGFEKEDGSVWYLDN